jgi:hypothetical protein
VRLAHRLHPIDVCKILLGLAQSFALCTCQPAFIGDANEVSSHFQGSSLRLARTARFAVAYGKRAQRLAPNAQEWKRTSRRESHRARPPPGTAPGGAVGSKIPVLRFAKYLNAVQQLDNTAEKRHGKHVMDLAVRWVLDQPGITTALWGARHPEELDAVAGALDWNLDPDTLAAIDQILRQAIPNPIDPEFMARRSATPSLPDKAASCLCEHKSNDRATQNAAP